MPASREPWTVIRRHASPANFSYLRRMGRSVPVASAGRIPEVLGCTENKYGTSMTWRPGENRRIWYGFCYKKGQTQEKDPWRMR